MRTKDEPVERGVRLGNDKGCSEAARVVWGNGAKRGVASRTRLSPLLTSRERAAGVAGCVTREGSDKTSVTRHGATDRGVVWWVGRVEGEAGGGRPTKGSGTIGAHSLPSCRRAERVRGGVKGGETCGEWRTHGVERGRKGVSNERPTGPVPSHSLATKGRVRWILLWII